MSLRKLSRLGGLAILAMAALTIPAHATLMVNIGGSVVGGTLVGGVTYFDNQPGVDSNPSLGVLDIGAFLNTVAINFTINGFAATSGSPISALASTANVNLLAATPLPLSVDVFITDTGFSLPPTPMNLDQTVNLLSSVGGITATSTAMGWYGDSNTEFDVDGTSTSDAKAGVTKGISINSPGVSGTINGPSPYSLTSHINLQITARGTDPIQNLQVNSNLAAHGENGPIVPEPTTFLLLGAALAFGSMVRMRKSS